MSEVEVVEVKTSDSASFKDGIIVQGDQEFPVEIAKAENIPVFKCADCGMLHIGEPGGFDESEVDVDLEELMNRKETKTPRNRIKPLYDFMKAVELRGMLPEKKTTA